MWSTTLLLLLACAGGGDGGPDKEEGAAPKADPRLLVDAATAGRGSVGAHLVGSAVVESEAQATLVPSASGVVTAIHAEEGDHVRKGQVLAVIASPALEGGYQRAADALAQAQTDVATADRLYAQGATSKAEVDLAHATLRNAQTAFDEATRTKGFTRLESPIDGTVAARMIRYGETAGPTPAFTVVDLDHLRVVVSLPERDLARVHVDQPTTLVSAYDDTTVATGRVARIAPVVDSASGTFRVTVAVEPGETGLRPGQFVSVRVEIDRHEDVLTVPRRALVWEEGKPFVYEVVELTAEELAAEKKAATEGKDGGDGEGKKGGGFSFSFGGEEEKDEAPPDLPGVQRKAVRRAVQVGYQDGELAEITSGIAEGARVLTVGNEALRDGARIRLPGDPTLADADKEGEKAAAPPTEGAAPTEGDAATTGEG